MSYLLSNGRFQAFDADGNPLVGGLLYTYFSGTTNPQTTFTDAALTVPNTNPVVLNARGEAVIFLSPNQYSLVLKDATGVTIWSIDGVVDPAVAAAAAVTTLTAGLAAGTVPLGITQHGTGAVLRDLKDKVREVVSSTDFGAKHDGVTDDTSAIQAAITYCQTSGAELLVEVGAALITTLTVTGSIKIRGKGPGSILRQKAPYVGNMINITGIGPTVEISDFLLDGQQTLQASLSVNDQINSSATGVNGGKPYYLVVDNVDFVNPAYRGIAFYGDNVDATREVGVFTRNRFRDGSTNATNTVYTPVDIHLVNGVEATVDNNDFYFSAAPTLPGGRCAVVVAQTQTTTPYFTKPIITNNRANYRGCNELASLGAIDLYIWSGMAVVADNVLTNSTATAIKFKGNSYDLSVVGNKVDSAYGTGGSIPKFAAISINNPNYGSSASQFLVIDNQVSNWDAGVGTGVISLQTYDGSQFSKNVVVNKNLLAAVSGIAIDINNCQDATISGNEVDGRSTIANGIRVLQCDGQIRIEKNKVANPTNFHIYVDTPLTAALDVVIEDNDLLGPNGTYMIYAHCRQAIVRKNFLSGGFNGINFGGGVQSAIALANVLANMAGTAGIGVTSTASNVIARDNVIVDSASITNPFGDSSSATFKVEEGNSWNGQVTWGTAAPAAGTWAVKDRRWNTTPNATSVAFWECTGAGTPGTWKAVSLV